MATSDQRTQLKHREQSLMSSFRTDADIDGTSVRKDRSPIKSRVSKLKLGSSREEEDLKTNTDNFSYAESKETKVGGRSTANQSNLKQRPSVAHGGGTAQSRRVTHSNVKPQQPSSKTLTTQKP
mmetsp:Transcript_22225/g.34398  ORF Transcript_22225/g.34398 Transcript_22225/m.34398 type:complete len:124 (-) Transcript_22225:853-1224(-)